MKVRVDKIEEDKRLLKSFPDFEERATEKKTNIKLNHHMTSTPGFEPEPNWWEASALDLTTPLASLVLTFLPLLPTNGGQLKDLCAGVCHFRNEKELS